MPSALVVGATTSLGKAIVRRLVFAGYKVGAAGECANATGAVAEDNKKVGGDVTAFAADVTKADHRKELIEKAAAHLGGVDSLIIVPPQNTVKGDILDASASQFDQLFNSHLTVPYQLVQAAVPTLQKSKNGNVVLLSSCAGYTPSLEVGLFSVVSTSILGLTTALAKDVGARGVRVNCVVSAMVENDGSGAFYDKIEGEEAVKLRQNIESVIPIGRLGRPSDVASMVEFLASSRARYITAENCVVNGGVSYRL